MTKQVSPKLPCRRVSRRSLLQSAALLSTPFLAKATAAFGQEKLAGAGEVVIFSYGGSYTQMLRKNVFEPFTKATGITVVDVTADLAEPQVRAMKQAGRIDWDLVLIDDYNVPSMREAEMLLPIDYGCWDDESLEGTPKEARTSDCVVGFRSATVLVYDERAFPGGGPKNWVDFWNVKAFPGARGLSTKPTHLSIPLAADGLPSSQVWPLTDEKIQRALAKLDQIKPHVAKWWSAGGEPVQALLNNEFAMTSCYDGRALQAIRQGAPLRIVWDRGHLGSTYYVILKGGPNSGNAQKALAYLNRAQVAANFTLATNLSGPNTNQLKYIPANIAPLLNINPENFSKMVPMDSGWLSLKRSDGKTNLEHVQEKWLAWRARG